MDGILIPILVAGTVATLVWGLVAVVTGIGAGDRKKLQERLTGEGRTDAQGFSSTTGSIANGTKSITFQLQVVGVPAFLADRPFIQALNRRMLQGYPEKTFGKFITTCAIYGAVFGGLSLVVTASFLVGFLALLAGFYAPFLILNMKRNKRQRHIAMQLPEALDFLTRVLRAGHSLSTGLQMMGEELPQPLGGEFQKAYDQHSLGMSLEDSLREASQRIDSSDFAFFVTAVLIQRQTGGDLSEVLKNISSMIRGRVRLAQAVKAKTAEGRFTGYVLVAFPAVMFVLSYYMNPGYAGVLINDPGGRMLLATAVGLQVLGLFAIKKITTVKV
jgi:tight adherence protein B